jgi:geranylgeranyl diphosphate synthase type II
LHAQRHTAAKTLDDIRWLFEMMQRVGSLGHARDVAARHAQAAQSVLSEMDWLPASEHRDMLRSLVDYEHERTR